MSDILPDRDTVIERLQDIIRKADETESVQWSEIDRLRELIDKKDSRIAELQREVESEHSAREKADRLISSLEETNARLEKELAESNLENRAICRRNDYLVKKNDELSRMLTDY